MSPGSGRGIEKLQDTLILCYFHLILKHLKLMGKVILFTSLPEEIWIAEMNTQMLKSPTYHTWLSFLGQILPGYI